MNSIDSKIQAVANAYITPVGSRKVVRNPRVEIEAKKSILPFGEETISFRSWGMGEIILLVHGWSATMTDMFNYIPEIVNRGYRAVALDLPAHGESSGERSGLDRLGAAVLAVGKHLGYLKGAIGHSIGAAALQVALADGLEVAKVVLLASPKDYEEGIREFARSQGLSGAEIDQVVASIESSGVNVKIRSADMVPSIAVPALIVHAIDDAVIPVQTAEELSRFWRESSLLQVEALGHRGVLRDPAVIEKSLDYLIN